MSVDLTKLLPEAVIVAIILTVILLKSSSGRTRRTGSKATGFTFPRF